jgi:hypothetical protein
MTAYRTRTAAQSQIRAKTKDVDKSCWAAAMLISTSRIFAELTNVFASFTKQMSSLTSQLLS